MQKVERPEKTYDESEDVLRPRREHRELQLALLAHKDASRQVATVMDPKQDWNAWQANEYSTWWPKPGRNDLLTLLTCVVFLVPQPP